MPTGGNAYVWGPGTQTIHTTCGRAWGHGGHFPGYAELPLSSPDGSRQAVLLVNADPSLIHKAS
jgi:D-alanyl-D-alanine carboxypeptidase